MFNTPDHPVVRSLEQSGYPGRESSVPRCPMCDEEADTFYKGRDGDIVGCPECITTVDAWDEQ